MILTTALSSCPHWTLHSHPQWLHSAKAGPQIVYLLRRYQP